MIELQLSREHVICHCPHGSFPINFISLTGTRAEYSEVKMRKKMVNVSCKVATLIWNMQESDTWVYI